MEVAPPTTASPLAAEELDGPAPLLPLALRLPVPSHLFGGQALSLALRSGLTVLLGPNGVGKTQVLRAMAGALKQATEGLPSAGVRPRAVRLLGAGRAAPFESFRGNVDNPRAPSSGPAAVGNVGYMDERFGFESLAGDFLALQQRADLRIKVEARLHALFGRRFRLQWAPNGIMPTFISKEGEYPANTEASGLLQIIGLLAALYDDEVVALLIDEPEISLHPQLQAFLLAEARRVAGDPSLHNAKKVVVLSTHAQGMLPLRRLTDLPDHVFFTDAKTPPRQVAPDAGVLASRGLSGLVARIGESHRAAFFAQTALLVEGASDEIVVGGLAVRLDRSLPGAGAQPVPVFGKGELPNTAKLFRLMGKRVVALADLDALADDLGVVQAFADQPGTRRAAETAGHAGIAALDKDVRSTFARMVRDWWVEIEPFAAAHRYMAKEAAAKDDAELDKRKRRAGLAALLTADAGDLAHLAHGEEWSRLRARFEALLSYLEEGGCFFLRRGTIEDYYLAEPAPGLAGKPDAAAAEVASFDDAGEEALRHRYADVLRAVDKAAPVPPVAEEEFLRRLLAGLLATAFQTLTSATTDDDLAQLAAAGDQSATSVFKLENATAQPDGVPALRVRIVSPLFARPSFPAVITKIQNLHEEVANLFLPAAAGRPSAGPPGGRPQ